jgi:hypothetical protein
MALLLVISVFEAWGQASKQPQWKEYQYPDDEFAIVALSSPGIYPDPQASDIRIYHWDLGPQTVLTLRIGVRPGCWYALQKMRDSEAKNPSDVFVPGSLKDVSQSDLPGMESEQHHSGYWSVERVYCSKEKAYALTLVYPVNQARPKTADRMFISFRLLHVHSQ